MNSEENISLKQKFQAITSFMLGFTAMIGYQYWLACFVYFLVDSPSPVPKQFFSFTATVSENPNFNICDKFHFLCSNSAIEISIKFIWNAFFIGLWASQHAGMGQMPVTKRLCYIFSVDYMIFQRSVYAMTALTSQLLLLHFWQPLPQMQFALPTYLIAPFKVIVFLALILYVLTMIVQKNDVWGMRKALSYLYEKSGSPYHPNDQVVFRWMRNPRQTAQIALLLFTSIQYNLGRLEFIIILTAGIFITIYFVDRRNMRQPKYKEYKAHTPNIFFPKRPTTDPNYILKEN